MRETPQTARSCQNKETAIGSPIRSASILLVEDNFDDRQFVVRAARKIGYHISLDICLDGAAAIDYINNDGEHVDREDLLPPDFVLLDLNLPKFSGLDVLEAMRSHDCYASVPVVVFSSSSSENDIRRAWRLGCSSFFTKPSAPSGYVELLGSLCDYWKSGFHLLPPQRRGLRF